MYILKQPTCWEMILIKRRLIKFKVVEVFIIVLVIKQPYSVIKRISTGVRDKNVKQLFLEIFLIEKPGRSISETRKWDREGPTNTNI